MSEWIGDNPYYLVIKYRNPSDGNPAAEIIDLDKGGWLEAHADYIGLPGRWYLVAKDTGAIILAMTVEDGDQPIYRTRHVAIGNLPPELPSGVQTEVMCHGIGKVSPTGVKRMIWRFPHGTSVMDEDANPIGMEILNMINGNVVSQSVKDSPSS